MSKNYDIGWPEIYMNDWKDDRILVVEKEHVCDEWRHGVERTVVVKNKEEGKYYRLYWRTSLDGEVNELRDGNNYVCHEVVPKSEMITVYKDEKYE